MQGASSLMDGLYMLLVRSSHMQNIVYFMYIVYVACDPLWTFWVMWIFRRLCVLCTLRVLSTAHMVYVDIVLYAVNIESAVKVYVYIAT